MKEALDNAGIRIPLEGMQVRTFQAGTQTVPPPHPSDQPDLPATRDFAHGSAEDNDPALDAASPDDSAHSHDTTDSGTPKLIADNDSGETRP